jgi:hypothetical protein
MEFNVGIGGRVPGELAPYVAIGTSSFDSVEAFQDSLPSCGKFAADIPNYSNVVGELQISDIV